MLLTVPNGTARAWIERKYLPALRRNLSREFSAELQVELVIRKRAQKAERAETEASREERPQASRSGGVRPALSAFFAPLPLNPRYGFENFVEGSNSRFAAAAARAVAADPGAGFNPLFIYGSVGLGKTHLLHAIGLAVQAARPTYRVAYVSAETFTSHFITSLRERRQDEFRRTYRGVDVWLVDDIQFIADKTGTREEFFHTFNELYLTNRQIVMAADRPPRDLRLQEERIRTRLESGLMVEVSAPNLETRVAILEQRARLEGADVPAEVLLRVAQTVTGSVRVMEAALIRILALASLNRCPITGGLAERALGAFVPAEQVAALGAGVVLAAVCRHFQVSQEAVTGPRRDRATAQARQVAMYLLRNLSRLPLTEIGALFGGKTHSTVLYSCEKTASALKADPGLAEQVAQLRRQLGGESTGPRE